MANYPQENLPRMQCARAIPVAWLGSGSCQARPSRLNTNEWTWKIVEEPDMPQVTMSLRKSWNCMPDSFVFGATAPPPPQWARASSFTKFLDHTQGRTTVGKTPLGEWSARRRDLYLTTHNTHNTQTSMPPVGFEPAISAGERPQTHTLDRAATGIDACRFTKAIIQTHPRNI